MKSDIKTVSLKSFAWTITLILILVAFVFLTLIRNSKSDLVQHNIHVLQSGDNNYRRIDTCISVLYVAENNSRLYAVTADPQYLDKYTAQMKTVSSILTEFQEEKKKQSFFFNLYLPELLLSKQLKNDEFISLKKMVDSLLTFHGPQNLIEVVESNKPFTVKTVRKIEKTDSVSIAPPQGKKRLWRRLVEAVSNKSDDSLKMRALKSSYLTIEDSLVSVKSGDTQVRSDEGNLGLARVRLKKTELELLEINNQIFSNLQSALKALRNEEINNVETLRMSLLLQTSDQVTELNWLSRGNIAVVLILTLMIIWNIMRLYKSERTILEYSNLAVQAAKRKGDFLSHVSHEIRTPLNAVIGFSRQIGEETLTPGLRTKVDAIRNSSDVLLMLVNEILDFSKFESGKIKLIMHPFHPLEMLQGVVGMLSILAENKEIRLTGNFELAPELLVKGDDFRLKQVVINVLTNAIKFTQTGGRVSIHAVFEKAAEKEQGVLKITVQDNGVGIASKNLEKIFEDFTQIETHDDPSRELGTGLGLAISKRIVDLYQGTIKVKSELGKGSVFTVELPLEIAKEVVVRHESKNLPLLTTVLQHKRILMVDDIKINLLLLSRFMDKNAVRYDLACDGEEAYRLFKSAHYDLVITDVQMPKMDGLQLTRLIRNDTDEKKSAVPIVGYTGNVGEDEKLKFLSLGMNDLLAKPFTEQDLVEVLSRVIF
jgi:signal transduction histidine kinase